MKKYFIHIFVAILILSSAFPTFSVSALSNPSNIEPEPQFLRDGQIRLESELTEDVKLRLQHRIKPIEERVQGAPTAEHTDLTRTQVESYTCTEGMDVPKTECEALVALYNSTNGAAWSDNDYWLTAGEVENWDGVEVEAEHVIRIVLPSNNLTGTIPAALGTLTNLGYLDLEGNQLSGSIPPELGSLNLLIDLYLDHNLLTGSIPPELGKLTNLQSLFLPQNQLTGSIPPELGNMTNLLYLFLEGNQLSGSIPAELGDLSNLRTLGLANNQLTSGIPAELGDLSNLNYLSLQENQLTGSIPSELGSLFNLYELYLYSNQLSGSIPLSFVYLTSLEYFNFDDTNLCEPEDTDLLVWKATVTDWDGTGFICTSYCEGVSEISVIECEALVAIYNSTSGPEWVGISAPWFTTTSFSSWDGVTVLGGNVTELSLSSNQLTGSIPPALGTLANLEYLELYGNQLSGSIPAELGNLANLHTLDLGANQLSGSIPPELGKLGKLTTLWLGANQLSGSLPTKLGDLSELQDFDLGVNPQLTGSIPLSFVNLTHLGVFYFIDTHLCEPADGTFQTWKGTVSNWYGTEDVCQSPATQSNAYETDEDNTLAITSSIGVLNNDSDANLDVLTAELFNDVTDGTLTLLEDGSFTYTPDLDFSGSDSFTYKAYDGELYSELASVIITVNPVNDSPVANGQTLETDEDTPLAITLTGSDVDGENLGFEIVTPPTHGTLSGTTPDITYTPEIDYYGSDSFTFRAYDGNLSSEDVSVTIMVNQASYSIYLPFMIK